MAETYTADVVIDLKPGLTDAEGQNTLKALKLLGFEGVQDVESAKHFHITLDADDAETAREEIEAMCERLLANPVVHDYTIEVQ